MDFVRAVGRGQVTRHNRRARLGLRGLFGCRQSRSGMAPGSARADVNYPARSPGPPLRRVPAFHVPVPRTMASGPTGRASS